MHVRRWYFGFHPPGTKDIWARLGHVEAWGYTVDNTWIFFDPTRKGTNLIVTHHHDEVEELLTVKNTISRLVLTTTYRGELRRPSFAPLTCAGQCGHLVGIRAFTISGLRRKLLQNGAEIFDGNAL